MRKVYLRFLGKYFWTVGLALVVVGATKIFTDPLGILLSGIILFFIGSAFIALTIKVKRKDKSKKKKKRIEIWYTKDFLEDKSIDWLKFKYEYYTKLIIFYVTLAIPILLGSLTFRYYKFYNWSGISLVLGILFILYGFYVENAFFVPLSKRIEIVLLNKSKKEKIK